ncbi:MAG: metallophosphoesterase [Hyphomicrobiaceae bacterium]
MPTRRGVLKTLGSLVLGGLGLAAYGFGIEPAWRLAVERYRLTPSGWPSGLKVRLAVIADLHAGEPYMGPGRIAEIVARSNALEADAILLLGDFAAGHKWQTRRVTAREWSMELAALKAPLGVHAVLGNHDWWADAQAQRTGKGPILGRRELERVGIAVYENDVVRLTKGRQSFWIAGLGDQIALLRGRVGRRQRFQGVDDLPGTLAKVTDNAPVILMAHEPDIFPRVPDRVALTISGHTHGGQVRLFGYSPIVPSQFGNRFAYGHVVEGSRHLIVSGGLGCSILPVRFGVPPEVTVIDLG